MKYIKKLKFGIILTLLLALGLTTLTSCGAGTTATKINVISREDGSGTRSAFIELFEIEEKIDDTKFDMTTDKADITNSTSVMMTSVSSNKMAMGYISLGSLNDTVKALKIDGAEISAANVKNGKYKISRPFNIVTKDGLSEVAQDFIDYILSKDAESVIENNGYIAKDNTEAYAGLKPSGKITISGSSSVTPVMEKLKEAYVKVNSNASIELQQSDSTTGVNNVVEGVCEIGMSSRELKASEIEKGITSTVIAYDGIAVIVNKENLIDDLNSENIKGIYTGEISSWNDLNN